MHHHHHHEPASYNRIFAVCMILNGLYFLLQVAVAFYVAHSIALVTDAIHNISDVAVLGAAWLANALLAKQPNSRRTFGLKGVSIPVSVASSAILFTVTIVAGVESVLRLWHPGEVSGSAMGWTATVGIVINFASAIMLHGGGKKDLNIRAAFTHQAVDAIQSAGVVVAGVLIAWQGWRIIDPITGIVISSILVCMTWGVMRDSVLLLINAVPSEVETQSVVEYLQGIPSVVEVHDLHIFGVSTAETAMTAHLVIDTSCSNQDGLIHMVSHVLSDTFGIDRATLQPEQHHATVCRHVGHLYGKVEAEGECHHEHLGHAH